MTEQTDGLWLFKGRMCFFIVKTSYCEDTIIILYANCIAFPNCGL